MRTYAKPTLGYPSRTDAVVALLAQDKSHREIAEMIGIPVTSVSALECSARRRKAHEGNGSALHDPRRLVHVSLGLLQRLAPHARRRNISREVLVARLIERIAEDDLVDAVLDDAEDLSS